MIALARAGKFDGDEYHMFAVVDGLAAQVVADEASVDSVIEHVERIDVMSN